ncbi:uncharacterized protein LOC130807880 isoform X1 [Amaranthus tricolor]|uniref:uncharacterized protein LOC130807880 isoform X1 n=1 Tax=Amaranthus tricolor TaxID=29722 RepID=UPI00258281E8|nr:uncharacterized protein LOC130807880 isoform X1 [Amaranthus tricolor]
MESYQQPQPHHHYMRPPQPPQPPPSMSADPHFSHHLQPPPPPPPSNSWFSGQFQYQPSHSPPPPPPPPQPQPQPQQQNQWGPSPPPYHAHPHQPYPAQHYPPPPPPPPPPPRPSQPPPPPPTYSHQDWTNANWNHHAGWEYPAHGNEEDWAAKARAWASARSEREDQYPQLQFTSVARQDEPPQYANQYAAEPHYQDIQQTSMPTTGFQNYQGPVAPLNRPPMVHQQEPAPINSYASDAYFSFAAKDGALGGDMSSMFPGQQGPASSVVHQPEVPSSYSSVPGKEDGSQKHQTLLPADVRSVPADHAHFAYGNHSVDPMDQPLNFASRLSHENDPKMKSGYPDSPGPVRANDAVSTVSSLHAWTTPAAPGAPYPPAFPLASQHDPSIDVPPFPGQPAPLFGRGPSFQSGVPAPGGLGAGSSHHPTAAFPADAYGSSLGSERPKKAAVPNWLREEIIKNKTTIPTSAPGPFKDGSQSNEDEIISKFNAKGDQADSKSMDSARSTEEEDDDDDDDYEEAQKTVAINQEIKRVLTEVLLKVTDELFEDIATQVLNEDDPTVGAEVNPANNSSVHEASPPSLPAAAPKATAKVLIPIKAKESEGHASRESNSGTHGNVLGLANYDSDDDDEVQTPIVSSSGAGENGHQQLEAEDSRKNVVAAEGDRRNGSSVGAESSLNRDPPAFNEHGTVKDLDDEAHQTSFRSSMSLDKKGDDVNGESIVKSTDNGRKSSFSRPDIANEEENSRKSAKDDSQEKEAKRRDRHESKRSSSGRDNRKGLESGKERESEREETHIRQDEKRQKKDKTEDYNTSREKVKEQDDKREEKVKGSDSRKKSSHPEDKDGKRDREKDKKRSSKDDTDKKRERTKDAKSDKSRHKSSDASRHRRRRSSSVGRKGRKIEESTDGSDEEASDDSKRKVHSKRRNMSPSPVRSRPRRVSRSPHSKHSQRRHSPYSSLDDSRSRRSRSRSRSPVHRRR